jgi:dolichol-phosphate mannosyltransferase
MRSRIICDKELSIAVVIPAYRVLKHIISVIDDIPKCVDRIYLVDDACIDGSGLFVLNNCFDPRIKIITNSKNLGVGGAVMNGYAAAINDGMDIIVKIDGDGQMDPKLIPYFIQPIINGHADYTKGNRFYELEDVKSMPVVRLLGNSVLSFLTKLSSGYWDIFDPTNGYTAIHSNVARRLPLNKISNRYFFESDMLFRLNTLRAVVVDIPMRAKYADEVSGLKVSNVLIEFAYKNFRNFAKRIFYNYYLRDLSVASIELPMGLILLIFGFLFGANQWVESINQNNFASAGTVMLSALPILIGFQLILSFMSYDIEQTPRLPINPRLASYD